MMEIIANVVDKEAPQVWTLMTDSQVGISLNEISKFGREIIERRVLSHVRGIDNHDLLKMISYDKDMFDYLDKDLILKKLIDFINNDLLLLIDNTYTLSYLDDISNKKELVFNYLNMDYSVDIFDKLMDKYKLVPSNHLVDLIYEALMYENKSN